MFSMDYEKVIKAMEKERRKMFDHFQEERGQWIKDTKDLRKQIKNLNLKIIELEERLQYGDKQRAINTGQGKTSTPIQGTSSKGSS
jgi:hypothetical protein